MDHVSDSFLETNVPLLVLIEAAKNGNEKEVKEYAQVFREHANKLIEVRWSCDSFHSQNLMPPQIQNIHIFLLQPICYGQFSLAYSKHQSSSSSSVLSSRLCSQRFPSDKTCGLQCLRKQQSGIPLNRKH